MKKIIVTTTINFPTEAIKKFAQKKDWELIIIGDQKTSNIEYYDFQKQYSNVIYLNCEDQENKYKDLSDLLGWNCIQRRNIGFIEAYKMGADIIATVDDDNIPYYDWGDDLLLNDSIEVNYNTTNTGNCDDPIHIAWTGFGDCMWHRGFPVQRIHNRVNIFQGKSFGEFDIQADFWNGAPDIDAIRRISDHNNYIFSYKNFPFTCSNFSPFNSQNTFLTRKVLKDYFMFPFIGRMDDIWASYYMEAKGYKVVYNRPSVYQNRNEHDIIKDLEQEMIGYKNNEKLLDALSEDPENIQKFIPERSWNAFKCYQNYFE